MDDSNFVLKSFRVRGYNLSLRLFSSALLSVALLLGFNAPAFASHKPKVAVATSGSLKMFDTEASAQRHCAHDIVVWLNTKTGIYHESGMRWFGRTKQGAYVCQKEADSAGDRDTRNGQ